MIGVWYGITEWPPMMTSSMTVRRCAAIVSVSLNTPPGIGVTAFFCFMFSWVELLLARTLTTVHAKPISAVMTRTVSAAGIDWGVLAAAGVLTLVPGVLVIWFVRNHLARGLALGRA